MKTLRQLKKENLRRNLPIDDREFGTNFQRHNKYSDRELKYNTFRSHVHSYIYEVWYSSVKEYLPFMYERDVKSYF